MRSVIHFSTWLAGTSLRGWFGPVTALRTVMNFSKQARNVRRGEGIDAQPELNDVARLQCDAAVGAGAEADELRLAARARPARSRPEWRASGRRFPRRRRRCRGFRRSRLADEIALGIAPGLLGEHDEAAPRLPVEDANCRRGDVAGVYFQFRGLPLSHSSRGTTVWVSGKSLR